MLDGQEKADGRRRAAAGIALVLGAATLLLALYVFVQQFPRGLAVLGCAAVALAAGWYGILRRGPIRVASLGVALIALVVPIVLLLTNGDHIAEAVLIGVGLTVSLAAARAAFIRRVSLRPAPRPERPVLFYNPKSGGGKAERFGLAGEARDRGIEPIELTRGADLAELVRDAVADGADALAMAGGDGSQAVVAAMASELDLPYACVPAGTRNHFALDLGVDRDDVVGALDAFVDGGERRVDLAEVNGQVFVNNVSLGLYAEAVQRPGYREAKLRTLLDTVPDVLGSDSELDLAWRGPGGHEHHSGAAVLVSNNRYRLGTAVGSGTRPRIDDGVLGITVASAAGWRTRTFRPTALARMVRSRVRGSLGPARGGRHRRRGGDARPAAAIPHQARRPAGANCSETPRRLSIGSHPGTRLGWHPGTGRHRSWAHTTDKGDVMDILEIETKETMSREEAAARLRAFADKLARNNDIEFERGGMKIKVHVPDEVQLKVELELETDERELEIELTW